MTSIDSDVLPLSVVHTVSITVGSPPINTVPGAQVVAEDTDLNIIGISAYDFDGNLASTRLSVVNGTLGVTLSGNAIISAGANNSNSVTISGSETDINATLASLIYRGSLHFNGADVLNIVSTDNVTLFTDTDTVAITVTPVNDAPTLASGNVLNYTESDSATVIDAGITVSDIDNSNIESASISIDSNYITGEDILQFTAIGNITGNFNPETGVLSLSGTDTVANYQAALRSLSYANTSDSPSINPRIINFVVNDDALNSPIASSIVNITEIEEAPFIPESAAGFDDLENGPLNALDLETEEDLGLSASLDFDDLIDQEDERLTSKVFLPEIKNVLSGNGTKSNPFVFEISSNKPIMLGSILRNVGKIEMPTEGLNETMGALDIVTVDNKLQIYFVPETAFSGDEKFSLQVYKNGILSATVYFEIKFSEALDDENDDEIADTGSVGLQLPTDQTKTDEAMPQNEEKISLLSKLQAAFTGEAEFQGDANTESDALQQRDKLESTKKIY